MSEVKKIATRESFGKALVELGKENENVVVLTADLAGATKTSLFEKEFPDRFINVGIAEQNMIGISAGLATTGKIPFASTFAMFAAGRAFEQVRNSVGYPHLNVKIGATHAGISVGEDGATHHGVFDLAYLRPIPNLVISSPLNEWDLRNLMYTGYKISDGPFVIRYPRGKGEKSDWRNEMQILPIGKGRKLREGNDIAVLSLGPIGNEAMKAIDQVEQEGISVAHYDMIYLKPLDEALLHEVGRKFKRIITIENGVIAGGLGSAVLEFMADHGYTPFVKRIGVPDQFIEHGSIPELYKLCGMDADSIAGVIRQMCTVSDQ